MFTSFFFDRDLERGADTFAAAPRPRHRIVQSADPFLSDTHNGTIVIPSFRLHHPHTRRIRPIIRPSRPSMSLPSFWGHMLGESDEFPGLALEFDDDIVSCVSAELDHRTEHQKTPTTWHMKSSFTTTSGDGRTTTKRIYKSSEGDRQEEEVRTVVDGDRVLTKRIKSSLSDSQNTHTSQSSNEEQTQVQETNQGNGIQAEPAANIKPIVVIEGAKDEDEFESLWNQRAKYVQQEREKVQRQRQHQKQQYEMRRAEYAAQVLAKHAEDMKKRAEEAEASAKRAKLRCTELLEEHQQQADQLNSMFNEDKEAQEPLSGEIKQVSGGNNDDVTTFTEEEKQEKVSADQNEA